MPRRVEDILPNEHRSVREIPIHDRDDRSKKNLRTEGGEKIAIHRIATDPIKILEHNLKHSKPARKHSKLPRKILIFLGFPVIVVVIAYIASSYFSRAVFTITPKVTPVEINFSYVASDVPKEGLLTYKIIEVESNSSSTVLATDGLSISAKAQGTLNIKNAYVPTARKLIAGTRFMSPDGKIYKLPSTIMIPGYKISATGAIIPGNISSLVVADQVGSEYNIDKNNIIKTFKIVAYEGGDKYDTIYGELASNISGGISGTKKSVLPSVLASTNADLKSKITDNLISKINSNIPADSFMFDKGYIMKFAEPIISGSVPNQAIITVRGTLYAITLNKDQLITKLAGQATIDSFGGLPFEAVGLDKVSFTLLNQKDFSPDKGGVAIMQLKGSLSLTGKVSVGELKKRFAGLSLSETALILRSYSPIIDLTKSFGQIVPPWSKIPKNADKISIIIK